MSTTITPEDLSKGALWKAIVETIESKTSDPDEIVEVTLTVLIHTSASLSTAKEMLARLEPKQ